MRRSILWAALVVGGCSASEPLPETVGDCDAELQAVRGQIETRKSELTATETLLRKTVEDRGKLEGDPDSDVKAARLAELEAARAELEEKVESLRAEVSRLEERAQDLTARREALAAAEAEASKAKAEEEARLRAEAEAKRKAEEESRAREEEARRKAEAEAESRRTAEEAARRKAEEDARKKAEEEAQIRAEAEAQRKLDEEKRRKTEALGRAESLVVEGAGLFREVQDAMKTPPADPEAVKLLLAKIDKALTTLDQAKAANAAIRGESADPARLDERLKKIDLLIQLLHRHQEALRK